MYIIRGQKNLLPRYRGAFATIGNFDGIHQGHQALFQQLIKKAQQQNAPALAITFEPHPVRILHPHRAPPRITSIRGKVRWMEKAGLDAMFILRFTKTLATFEPEHFIRKILVDTLAIRGILVGYDFRFGKQGQGNFDLLTRLGKQYDFTTAQFGPLYFDDQPFSSTRVRQAVQNGDFTRTEALLGRPFEIEGRVNTGFQRGRHLGFPTANLMLTGMLHPPAGVYVVEGYVDNRWLPGVANIGHNPTFGEDTDLNLETHFLEPCGEIYRRVLRIRFLKYLRREKKFPNPQSLQEQITRDVTSAKALFAQRHTLP
ncbi:riboflavin biosynthesis protein RibF [Magnetococcales bacterium HHB-1]